MIRRPRRPPRPFAPPEPAPHARRAGGLLVLLAAAGATVAAGAAVPPPLDVRSLPSLAVRWQAEARAYGLATDDRAVYLQEPRRVWAVDPARHEVLWERAVEPGGGPLAGGVVLVPERVATAWSDRVLLLDRATGAVVADVAFAGPVRHLVGPPLVAHVVSGPREEAHGHELVRIDTATGVVLARRRLEVRDLEVSAGRLFALAEGRLPGGPPEPRLVELSPDDLATVRSWGEAGGGELLRLSDPADDRLVVRARRTAGGKFPRRLLVPRGQRLGPPRPPPPGDFWYDLAADLQTVYFPRASLPLALRRVAPESGRVAWTTPLPGKVGAWARDGPRLHVHTGSSDGGRGLLLTLDFATGEIERAAYGLLGVHALARWRDLLVALHAEGVSAFAADELGPPESEVVPLATAVDRVLARIAGRRLGRQDDGAVEDLLALGEAALPLLEARLDRLACDQLLSVAAVFGEAGYTAAAPRLATLLGAVLAPAGEVCRGWAPDEPAVPLLRALGRIGGREEVAAVGAALAGGSADPEVREQAVLALGGIALPEVLPWLDRLYGPSGLPSPGPGAEPWREEDVIRYTIVRHWRTFAGARHTGRLCVVSERDLFGTGPAGELLAVAPGARDETCHVLNARPAPQDERREYEIRSGESPGAEERLWVLDQRSMVAGSPSRFVDELLPRSTILLRRVGERWLVRRFDP